MSALISTAAVRDGSPDFIIIDVRWRLGGPSGRLDYEAGHIPGAMYVDLDSELCGPPGPAGRHPLPDVDDLQRVLRAVGVSSARPVVVYDYGDGMAAARAWWTLRWVGHPDVRVIDGGYAAWTAAGLPISTDPSDGGDFASGDFTVVPGGMPMLDAAEAAVAAKSGVLIDARQAPRYRGETEPIDPVAGHIPGARNVPYADLVEADGRLHAVGSLRSRFSAAGVSGTDIAAYCGSGVTAAHTVLALAEAGFGDAGLYVGSWSNWVADPDRPVATGGES